MRRLEKLAGDTKSRNANLLQEYGGHNERAMEAISPEVLEGLFGPR